MKLRTLTLLIALASTALSSTALAGFEAGASGAFVATPVDRTMAEESQYAWVKAAEENAQLSSSAQEWLVADGVSMVQIVLMTFAKANQIAADESTNVSIDVDADQEVATVSIDGEPVGDAIALELMEL